MDIQDVSGIPQFMQMLDRQKRNIRNAQSHKGQKFVPKKARSEIITSFMLALMMNEGKGNFGPGQLKTSFIPPAYPPCIEPLSGLGKIMINQLLLETHHRGSYLLLRSMTPPDRMSAVMAIVEDENEDVRMLQLYHREDERERAAEDIIHVGTVMIVKEPFLKLMSDGEYGLRVDHLSDVIFPSEDDGRIPEAWKLGLDDDINSADAWKAKGNNHFAESNYFSAIECYTRGLDYSPTADEAETIRLNRCLTFLKTRQFDAALSDANLVLSLASSEKAVFRKAQALYSLQRYRESCEVFKALLLEYPNNAMAKAELARAVKRCLEQEHARYSFKQFYQEANKLRPPHLDHATYIGPVAVKESGSRGRGLFTTEAVKAGDLLLCEKAFAHAFVDSESSSGSATATVLIYAEAGTVTVGGQSELTSLIVKKISRNPSLASRITELHHGSYQAVNVSEIDGMPVVDTFLVERIISLNSFGCPLSSKESRPKPTIDNINKNANEDAFHSCGVWPMASYINHECYSNSRRSFIGDMMIVRASQDLPADTELTWWYQIPEPNNYEKRQKRFQHWGFECQCTMCRDEKEAGKKILLKRGQLMAELSRLFQSGKKANASKIESVLANLDATYTQPASEVPRVGIWEYQYKLAHQYSSRDQWQNTAKWALASLTSLGYIIEGGEIPRATDGPMVVKKWGLMMNQLIYCWLLLSDAYRFEAPALEAQAMDCARISYKICFGEDDTFQAYQ